jgi:CMP-N-acetylneuraminic acid synthetase
MNILGLIPARGGSKGIPHKNIIPLAGKPLIAYTILAALASPSLSRVIVSTDDPQIQAVAQAWGAEVPTLRPAELAADTSPALGVIQHMVDYLARAEGWAAEVLVYLQPTSPLRRAEHLEGTIKSLLETGADTAVSVMAVPHQFNPYSVMKLEAGGLLPFMAEGVGPLRRQEKPEVWARNGPAVLAIRAATIAAGQLYGPRVAPYIMNERDSVDIDRPEDLALAEFYLSIAQSGIGE